MTSKTTNKTVKKTPKKVRKKTLKKPEVSCESLLDVQIKSLERAKSLVGNACLELIKEAKKLPPLERKMHNSSMLQALSEAAMTFCVEMGGRKLAEWWLLKITRLMSGKLSEYEMEHGADPTTPSTFDIENCQTCPGRGTCAVFKIESKKDLPS
jgi:hypothetical protein